MAQAIAFARTMEAAASTADTLASRAPFLIQTPQAITYAEQASSEHLAASQALAALPPASDAGTGWMIFRHVRFCLGR